MTNTNQATVQKHKFSVQIKSNRTDCETVVVATDEYEAFGRAIKKLFGKKAFWFPDSGLDGFGQIATPLPYNQNGYSTTERCWYEVNQVSKSKAMC